MTRVRPLYDAFTTSKGIRNGSGVKADRMPRNHNRVGAIATMIVSNES